MGCFKAIHPVRTASDLDNGGLFVTVYDIPVMALYAVSMDFNKLFL